jgi:kinesin family member 2/24
LNTRQSFQILEDSFGDTQLVGVQDIHVTSAPELLKLIERASSFRHTASTEKNDGSSRSHAICRIRVKNPSPESLDDGVLYLVDLAGSEIARDVAAHTANRMKETREINISLSVLKDCIRERAALDAVLASEKPSSKKPYIPFRRSALTKVLKHLFDPADDNLAAKTIVLGCINPSFLDVAASKNTLRYAEMLRVVTPKPKQVEFDPNIPTTWTNKDVRNYIQSEVCIRLSVSFLMSQANVLNSLAFRQYLLPS